MNLLRHPFLPGIALSLIGLVHPWLEATMVRHMVAELPLLFASGYLLAHALGGGGRQRLRAWGRYAAPALLAALLITSVWMLPLALDAAVLDPRANLLKVASLVLAGFLTGASWRRAGVVLQGFFLVNWAGMTITAGLLYQDAPQQLCSVYLNDQQAQAGVGIVTLAALVLVVWLLQAVVFPSLAEAPESASSCARLPGRPA